MWIIFKWQKFRLRVLLSISLIFFQFRHEVGYGSVSYKKSVHAFQDVLNYRSSHPEVFIGNGTLKICSKFTEENPWQSVISIKLLGCSSVNLLHIFRTPFSKNTSGWLLLKLVKCKQNMRNEDRNEEEY